MASPYTQYTPEQINTFLDSKGAAGSDPWAMLAYARQHNADPMAVAAARGIDPTVAQQWLTGAQQQLSGPVADTRGLADRNPYMAYNLAKQRGMSNDQAATMYGKDGNTVNDWLSNAGLHLTAPTGTMPPISGTMPPMANTPMPLAPSTAGSTPAAMPTTGGGNGTVGVPDYMVSPSSNQGGNPYMPAGGPRANYGNDPRIGGPSGWGGPMGNQGFRGLADYLFDNPSTQAMGNEVTRGVMNTLQRQALPAIRGNAMAAGTVGGSRQGVAEGLATGEAMSGLAGALANLYGNQFNQDRSYGLQDRGLGLQSDALDFNIHRGNLQDMRQGQLDSLGFMDQMTRWGQQGVGVANQTRERPFTDWQKFVGPASQMAGLGGQQSQTLQGNPYLGALGGYLAGSGWGNKQGG